MENEIEQRITTLNCTPVMYPVTCPVEKKSYTVQEIQDILCISQSTAYSLIKRGLFHCVKIGNHIRISKLSFDTWLDGQVEGAS